MSDIEPDALPDQELNSEQNARDKNGDQDLRQSELVHNEKLKALGLMSAGLAHEINNPLNYALLGLEVLKSEGREMLAPEFDSILHDIEDGLLRIRNIVQDLKVYSRKPPDPNQEKETFLVGDAVAAAIRIVATNLDGIELNTVLNTPYRVTGDASSIIQVLINLINNSADSVRNKWEGSEQGGGKIDILGNVVDRRYVVEVADNGEGIASDKLGDIFTPFYTTKPSSSGTGIGMSICQVIIERHDGKLLVESSVGAWTSVTFDLEMALSTELSIKP